MNTLHINSISTLWLGRLIATLASFLIIRLISDGIGTDYSAVFIFLTGLLGWYAITDLGIGYSVQNFISEAKAKNKNYDEFIILGMQIGAFLLTIGLIASYLISIFFSEPLLQNFSFLNEVEIKFLILISSSLYIVTTIGSIGYKIWYAENKPHLANLFPALGSIFGLLLVYLIQESEIENKMIFSMVGFLLPSAFLSILALFYRINQLKVSSFSGRYKLVKILKRGSSFFYMSFVQAIIVNIDYLILIWFVSSSELLIYGIISRLFGFCAMFYSSIYTILWPRFTEEIVKKSWKSALNLLFYSNLFSLFFILIFSILLILFIDVLISFLVNNDDISVPINFIVLYAVFDLVRSWVHGFGTLLQSISHTKPFITWLPIQAILNVLLQFLLVPEYGIYGCVVAMLLSFIFTLAWILPLNVYKKYKISQNNEHTIK